jgi:hypothetical protein
MDDEQATARHLPWQSLTCSELEGWDDAAGKWDVDKRNRLVKNTGNSELFCA